MEYLHGEQESFLDKFSHVEYKRLKKVLKTCRSLHGSYGADEQEDENSDALSRLCRYESCPCEYLLVYGPWYILFCFFLGLLCAAIGVGYFTIDDRWKEIFSKIEIRPLILVGKFDLNMRKQRMKENEEWYLLTNHNHGLFVHFFLILRF